MAQKLFLEALYGDSAKQNVRNMPVHATPTTAGEGGAVFADDAVLAARLAYHRNLCFDGPGSGRRFVHYERGSGEAPGMFF